MRRFGNLSIAMLLLAATLLTCGIVLSAPTPGKKTDVPAKPPAAYCKLCGAKYSDAGTLLRNSCSHNNGGKGRHVLFEGEESDKYICENCGNTYSSLKDLTRNTCPHGNGSAHVPYRGGIRDKYSCRWCGREYKSLKDMTRTSCSRHPDGKGNHRPGGN